MNRYVYPDFLPNPIPYLRDRILEKLERKDMFRRRQQINIPEFYVGSYSSPASLLLFGEDKKYLGVF